MNTRQKIKTKTWQTLGHDGESNPRNRFISVIRTGHQVEHLIEWIAVRIWNPSLLGTRWPEVAQQYVGRQIAQLSKHEQR